MIMTDAIALKASSGNSKIITYPCRSMKGEVGDKYGVKAMDFRGLDKGSREYNPKPGCLLSATFVIL